MAEVLSRWPSLEKSLAVRDLNFWSISEWRSQSFVPAWDAARHFSSEIFSRTASSAQKRQSNTGGGSVLSRLGGEGASSFGSSGEFSSDRERSSWTISGSEVWPGESVLSSGYGTFWVDSYFSGDSFGLKKLSSTKESCWDIPISEQEPFMNADKSFPITIERRWVTS